MPEKPTYEELEQRVKELEKAEADHRQAEEALRESEERFRKIAENALVGVNIIQDDRFIYVNPKFAEIFGYTVAECLDGMHFPQLVHPEDLPVVQQQIRRRESGESKFVHYAFRGLQKSGAVIHVEIYGSSMPMNGKPAVVGTILDITERKQMEERLCENERRFRSLFEESKDAILNTDMAGNLLLVNPAGMELFGLADTDLSSVNFRDLYVDRAMSRRFSRAIRERGHIRDFGIQLYGKGGKVMDCLMTVVAKKSDAGALIGYEGIIRDVSPYKKMEEELRRLATTDSLTGIHNRRHFLALARKEMNRSRRFSHPFSLVMLDIDHFKKVNDTFGHSAGDQVLIEFCAVCMKELRNDDFMGRLGGEEFAVALMECTIAEAAAVADRIRRSVAAHPVTVDDETIRFTVSLGVADAGSEGELNDLMERADAALYAAKENGRNQVRTDPAQGVP